MNKSWIFVALTLLAGAAVLGAQNGSPPLGPEEPDIVLPEVILRIEDLSVEDVEAGVPRGEELGAPEHSVPLPPAEELEIAEPQLPVSTPEGRDLLSPAAGSALSAQAVLGAGNLSHLYSLVSLNRIGGEEPRFKLRFLHEMLDGIGGNDPGSGFHTRRDDLEGGFRAHLGQARLESEGSLRDEERGLQGHSSAYLSQVYRTGAVNTRLTFPLGERFSLSAGGEASFSAQLLTGSVSQSVTELLAEPLLALQFRGEKVRLTLEGRYKYRGLIETAGQAVHRAGVRAQLATELSSDYRLQAEAGWTYSSLGGSLFPFALSLSATPFASFSFQVAAGYRVEESDFAGLMEAFPFAVLPAQALRDNGSWFGDLALSFTLTPNISLQARGALAWASAALDPLALDPVSGLFLVSQGSALEIDTGARLRWNLGSAVSASAGLDTQFGDRSTHTPLHAGVVELEATDAQSRWGGKGSLEFAFGYPPGEQASLLPLLSASGFYSLTDSISFVAELDDLLYPFAGERWLTSRAASGKLYSWYPYEAPGLRGMLKVRINL